MYSLMRFECIHNYIVYVHTHTYICLCKHICPYTYLGMRSTHTGFSTTYVCTVQVYVSTYENFKGTQRMPKITSGIQMDFEINSTVSSINTLSINCGKTIKEKPL